MLFSDNITTSLTAVVHTFDTVSGKELGDGHPLHHNLDVLAVSLSHAGPSSQRLLALVDKNHDLYITSVRGPQANKIISIGSYTIAQYNTIVYSSFAYYEHFTYRTTHLVQIL